jgi:type II secretory pathway pseudopilin PulG
VQISIDPTPDEGFTLVEVVVSLAIVMLVMTASATFMVDSTRVSHQRSVRDSAAELSMQGMENAHGLHGSALLEGRTACTSLTPCAPVVSGKVDNLLGLSAEHWDAVGSGALTLPKPGLQSDGSVVLKPSDPEIVLLLHLTVLAGSSRRWRSRPPMQRQLCHDRLPGSLDTTGGRGYLARPGMRRYLQLRGRRTGQFLVR